MASSESSRAVGGSVGSSGGLSRTTTSSNSTTSLRPHSTVAFEFTTKQKPLIAQWHESVRTFISDTASFADTKFYVDKPGDSPLLFIERIPSNIVPNEAALEAVTVQTAVHLICNLAHFSQEIRMGCAKLLYSLGTVLNDALHKDTSRIENLVSVFSTDNNKGYFGAVTDFFKITASSFSIMAVSLVAGLENFYNSHDAVVRGVVFSTVTKLITENKNLFLDKDNLTSIWNLYFAFLSLPLISKVYPDRLVVIQAFFKLAGMYAGGDEALTVQILESLLRLKEVSRDEIIAVRSVLKKLFELVVEGKCLGVNEEKIFTSIVNLLMPSDEHCYDLLEWSLETFVKLKATAPTKPGSNSNIIAAVDPLLQFIKSLTNHFRATPPLVRYGAAICLHVAISIRPDIMTEWPGLWEYIITGALDADYLTSFVYLSILEAMKTTDTSGESISTILAKIRSQQSVDTSYDSQFGNTASTMSSTPSSKALISKALESAIKLAPPLPPRTMNKMTNALEYMDTPHRLKQLEIVRLWASRLEKFDSFLMQSLVPLLNMNDEETQLATTKTIMAMVPTFKTATESDIAYLWSYFKLLLSSKTKIPVLMGVLELMKSFPVDALHPNSRDELVTALFKLTFHREPAVRSLVYSALHYVAKIWGKESSEEPSDAYTSAVTVMLLAMGEQTIDCANTLFKSLRALLLNKVPSLFRVLDLLHEAILAKKMTRIIRLYDAAATYFVTTTEEELTPFLSTMQESRFSDSFWSFYLFDAPENELVRPDDYSYSRNFVQCPFWVSLLYCKMGVRPPPLGSDYRDAEPQLPAAIRRYHAGFLMCTLPTAGIPDPVLRKGACETLIRCCIKSLVLQPLILRSLLEFISQQMFVHKQWTFQSSAFDILRMLMRLRISGMSTAAFGQFVDIALDRAANVPSSFVRIAALEYLETALLVFPQGVSMRIMEIRDCVRDAIVNKDPQISALACRIYPLVFRRLGVSGEDTSQDYLKEELRALSKSGAEAAADPLISSLTSDEKARVLLSTIEAMGYLDKSPVITYRMIQDLLPYLKSPNAELRAMTLFSILSQAKTVADTHRRVLYWVIAPLIADTSKLVRDAFYNSLNNIATSVDDACEYVSAHVDDSFVLSPVDWKEILTSSGAEMSVSKRDLDSLATDVGDIPRSALKVKPNFPQPDLHLPVISESLNETILWFTKEFTGPVANEFSNEILYFLQDLKKNPSIQGPCILVLSEYCNQHAFATDQIIEIVLHELHRDVTADSSQLIEACILAISNLCRANSSVWGQVILRYASSSLLYEGELLSMLYLVEFLRDMSAQMTSDFMAKFTGMIASQKYTTKKRVLAVYLATEVSVNAQLEDIMKLVDAIHGFLDYLIEDGDVRPKVTACLTRIVEKVGPSHVLFKSLIAKAKTDVKSSDAVQRSRSLTALQVFGKYLTQDEIVWLFMHYFADSNTSTRQRAKEIAADTGIVDFMKDINGGNENGYSFEKAKTVRAQQEKTRKSKRDTGLGMVVSQQRFREASHLTSPPSFQDPFNVEFYKSARRKKFSQRYGIAETKYENQPVKATPSLLKVLEQKNGVVDTTNNASTSSWILQTNDSVLLAKCLALGQNIANDMISELLNEIETLALEGPIAPVNMNATTFTNPVAEQFLHNLNLVCTLLIVSSDATFFVDRLKELVTKFSDYAQSLRNGLYDDLESSYFFFNDFADMPITSEEQFLLVESFRLSLSESTSEILKAGTAEKLSAIHNKRKDVNESVEAKGDRLQIITDLSAYLIQSLGSYFAFTPAGTLGEDSMKQAVEFISAYLYDEHGGIREASVEGLITMCDAHLAADGDGKSALTYLMESLVKDILTRLEKESETLCRRKADLLRLLGHCCPYLSMSELRVEIIQALSKGWRDTDSEVRLTCIDMVLMLAEMKTPEVLESFHLKSRRSSAQRDTKIPSLMEQVSSLINMDEYPEKPALNEIMDWYFITKRGN